MNTRKWTTTDTRIATALVTFVAICWGGCLKQEVTQVTPADAELESAMRPLAISASASRQCNRAATAAFPNNGALFWLARCDEIEIRWNKYQFTKADGTTLDVCHPTDPLIPNVPLSLFKFPDAMRGAADLHATYEAEAGCVPPPPQSSPPPVPPNLLPDERDYLLELYPGTEPAKDPAEESLLFGRVSATRTIARVLTQEPCRAQDGNGLCVEADYAWSVRTVSGGLRSEAYSPSLRIGNVRVLQGRAMGSAAGVEDLIPGEPGFACDIDNNMQCISLPFEFIEPNLRGEFRCVFNESVVVQNGIDLLTGCHRGMSTQTVTATPDALFVGGMRETPVVVWRVRFNAATGFPLPDSDKTIALEFTLASP